MVSSSSLPSSLLSSSCTYLAMRREEMKVEGRVVYERIDEEQMCAYKRR
jgi:hypothetical protein